MVAVRKTRNFTFKCKPERGAYYSSVIKNTLGTHLYVEYEGYSKTYLPTVFDEMEPSERYYMHGRIDEDRVDSLTKKLNEVSDGEFVVLHLE